jgi:hypothetical protein
MSDFDLRDIGPRSPVVLLMVFSPYQRACLSR